MPTYEYLCPVHGEFETEHSIKIKLEHCPQCKEAGNEQTVKRLISLGGKGVVELSGQELVDKLKGDAKKIQKDAAKDEKVYANLLGEDKYQSLQQRMDRQKRR
jgi:putative FmdB family regulatory protein